MAMKNQDYFQLKIVGFNAAKAIKFLKSEYGYTTLRAYDFLAGNSVVLDHETKDICREKQSYYRKAGIDTTIAQRAA